MIKQKYRILKLKPFMYIVQIQRPQSGKWVGYDGKDAGYGWTDERYQMEFCRTYTLFGAKMMLPNAKQISKRQEKEEKKAKALSDLFRKASIVYETEIENETN